MQGVTMFSFTCSACGAENKNTDTTTCMACEKVNVVHSCVLCAGQIPSGWPVLILPQGLAHRMRNTCDALAPEVAEAAELLHSNGALIGTHFTAMNALEMAGVFLIEKDQKEQPAASEVHVDCPCWQTGKYHRVDGCKFHPYDL